MYGQMRDAGRQQRIAEVKDNPFHIEAVERSVSTTSFDLRVQEAAFEAASMHDLLLFVHAQLPAIQGGPFDASQKLSFCFSYDSKKLHKCVQNVIYSDELEEEATILPASESKDHFKKIRVVDFINYK